MGEGGVRVRGSQRRAGVDWERCHSLPLPLQKSKSGSLLMDVFFFNVWRNAALSLNFLNLNLGLNEERQN